MYTQGLCLYNRTYWLNGCIINIRGLLKNLCKKRAKRARFQEESGAFQAWEKCFHHAYTCSESFSFVQEVAVFSGIALTPCGLAEGVHFCFFFLIYFCCHQKTSSHNVWMKSRSVLGLL